MIAATQAHLIVEKIETNVGFAEIKIGKVDIVSNHNIVFHIINPLEIEKIVDQLEANALNLQLEKPKMITLEHEIRNIKNKIKTLIPHRHKRGLFNFVGTIHKWLYGTMDSEDREEIERHLSSIDINNHNIINNVNQQVKINKYFNESFIQLKEAIEKDRLKISTKLNEIISYSRRLYCEFAYIDNLLKLKILSDNVEHIQNNIASSRIGIIHSNILTNEEIEEYQIDLEKLKNIKLGTIIDKSNNLIFVIMIPKDVILVDKILITSMTNNENEEIILETKEIIKFENKTYQYVANKEIKNLKINDNCISKRNCMKTFNNISEIRELDQGVILFKNQKNENLNSTCDKRNFVLTGNYLITFHNCSIKINNLVFRNHEKEFKQSFAIPNYLEDIKELNKKLTFDEIIFKQIENTKEITELKFQKHIHYAYGGTLGIIIIIIIIVIILAYKCKKPRIKINNVMKTQESLQSSGGRVTSFPFPHPGTENNVTATKPSIGQPPFSTYHI